MEFTFNNVVYRTGVMSAFTQFHIVRRLTPCLGKLAAFTEGSKDDDSAGLALLIEAVGALKDDDAEFILNACMDVTERKQGSGWAKLRTNGSLMFDDIKLPAVMAIAYHVFKDNLADFFTALPSNSSLEGLTAKIKASLGSAFPAAKTGS